MTKTPALQSGRVPPQRPAVSAAGQAESLDLATLLALIESRAVAHRDGHLTILRFTTGWKILLGTPDLDSGAGREEVWQLPTYPTLREALVATLLASNPSAAVKCWATRPSR